MIGIATSNTSSPIARVMRWPRRDRLKEPRRENHAERRRASPLDAHGETRHQSARREKPHRSRDSRRAAAKNAVIASSPNEMMYGSRRATRVSTKQRVLAENHEGTERRYASRGTELPQQDIDKRNDQRAEQRGQQA